MTDKEILDIISLLKEFLRNKENHIRLKLDQSISHVENTEVKEAITKLVQQITDETISESWIERRVDELNNVILKNAIHNYSEEVPFVNNDLFDSIAISLKYLGETLQKKTITNFYLKDIFNSLDENIIVTDMNYYVKFVNKSLLLRTSHQSYKGELKGLFDESTQSLIDKNGRIISVTSKKKNYLGGDNNQVGYLFILK